MSSPEKAKISTVGSEILDLYIFGCYGF